ncbi:MAG: protein kinase, partial [Verrucomicrobiota bacterium]
MENLALENYSFHEVLGEGSCGRVYRCSTPEGDMRAVKVLTEMTINRQLVTHLLEKQVLMPRHPGVARIYSYEMDEVPLHYVTDLFARSVAAPTGGQRWRSQTIEDMIGSLSGEQSWQVIHSLTEALAHLHEHDLFHCCIKPSNLFVSGDGSGGLQVTVGDLGQGWVNGARYLQLHDIPYYASPEQLRTANFREEHVKRWDVYSFGVVGYLLLNCRLPRMQEQYSQWWQALQNAYQQGGSLAQDVDLSPYDYATRLEEEAAVRWVDETASEEEERLRRVIDRCLTLKWEDRYADMGMVKAAFMDASAAGAAVAGEEAPVAVELGAEAPVAIEEDEGEIVGLGAVLGLAEGAAALEEEEDEAALAEGARLAEEEAARLAAEEEARVEEEAVDFIGNLDVSSNSRKSSQAEEDVDINESPPESAIGLTPTQSPTSISSTFEIVTAPPEWASDSEHEDSNPSTDKEKDDSDLDSQDKEEEVTSNEPKPESVETEPPKKVIYTAGKGLKGLKQKSDTTANKPKGVTPQTKTELDNLSRSSSTRSVSSRDGSGEQKRRAPISRSSSEKSSSRTTSSVLQNKLLFDQQIANQWKSKPPSEPSSGQSSLSNSRKSSLRSANELPASGTVAGARSMFEATSTPNSTRKKDWSVKLETSSLQPAPDKDTKSTEQPSSDAIKELVSSIDASKEISSTTKKKRFPFKKKKASMNSKKGLDKEKNVPVDDNVKLVNVQPLQEEYQERAIDVPNDVIDDSTEKKKKGGLFSKIRRRSHKNSGGESSDSEVDKVVVTLPTDSKLENDVIEEKEEIEPSKAEKEEEIKNTTVEKDVEPNELTMDVKEPTVD